jgi:hypothetical protein
MVLCQWGVNTLPPAENGRKRLRIGFEARPSVVVVLVAASAFGAVHGGVGVFDEAIDQRCSVLMVELS